MVVAIAAADGTSPQLMPYDAHALQRRIEGRRRPQKTTSTAEEHLALRERLNNETALNPNHAKDTKINIQTVKRKWIR
jgi:hypothetical protein